MRRNLDALNQNLHDAISDWNYFTDDDEGYTLLDEEEICDLADSLYSKATDDLFENGKI